MKAVLFSFVALATFFIGTVVLKEMSDPVSLPSDVPRMESPVVDKQPKGAMRAEAANVPLASKRRKATRSKEREVVEGILARSERPKDWSGEVNDLVEFLARITGLPRSEIFNTRLEDLVMEIRLALRDRDFPESKIDGLVKALTDDQAFRKLSLAEFLRMKRLQKSYHLGEQLSDDDIDFLYRVTVAAPR